MIDLLSMTYEELGAMLKEMGQPKFRAKQLYEWLNRGASWDEMRNLPTILREQLAKNCTANPIEIERSITSKIDGTQKFLFRLMDGNLVEGVLMRYHHGATLCLSTQVGCKMGCAFCASTLDGCVRNLTPGEMLGQVVLIHRRLMESGSRIANLVLMGSGEPLDNYDNVLKFIRLAIDERGLNLSTRGISLSTCGLVPEMDRLSKEGLQLTLSLSLHASNDKIRREIMPIANVYTIQQTLDACKRYIEKTGRRVILEYALIDSVNDDLAHADELSRLLRGMQCHVNLIPLNEVAERNLRPPSPERVRAFLTRLEHRHISATVRREMGSDIQGACGQLRRHAMNQAQ
ncbi:23S rRNA (adenine(2503)-C(2))-methyltransferase RlmN [Eubacteriales bacterium OttesenSCG-928-N13]|nr:23S rRNA (adenine(2503)-C(2))-methyltransferase RlmN [Eubacteriales bacterium OttesenSCG-928-N13]